MTGKIIDKILSALKQSKNVLIVSHVDPDCDTLGSALAFSLILKNLEIKHKLFCENTIPDEYKFLPNCEKYIHRLNHEEKFDLCVVLDCSDIKRIGLRYMNNISEIINIDHHLDNTMFGKINYVEQAAATAVLVVKIIKKLRIKIDKPMAVCLYAAIITDTGSFRYDNTTSDVFELAAELVDSGADPFVISKTIYENKSIPNIKILGEVLNKLEVYSGKIAWTYIDVNTLKKFGASPSDLSGIVDFLRSIKGVEVSVFAREYAPGKIKINLRSKGPNIQKIAKKFGGGGHPKASGIDMSGDIKQIKKELISSIKSTIL